MAPSSSKLVALAVMVKLMLLVGQATAAFDYGEALTKSLLYFEAQRSGRLPRNQRVSWRGDSALTDGEDNGVDLSGGYYDAGDNVKFGLPMAYTVTMLSWGAVEFSSQLQARKEFDNALAAIKWGSDYLVKAHAAPDVLYVQVGDGDSDHSCWQRPEDMTTPRTSFKVDASSPGSDVAAETAAALAAASIAFQSSDAGYAATLLNHSKQLLDFARNHRGVFYSKFYPSSGDDDEILWAAAWLHRATGDKSYLNILSSGNNGGVRTSFSWDDKYVGVQALISKLVLEGKVPNSDPWAAARRNLEAFVCNVVQKGSSNVQMSPGGMLFFLPWSNTQYINSAMLALAVHDRLLSAAATTLQCPGGSVSSGELVSFIKSQMDYILGDNPRKMSYMVGFGSSFPIQVHHRGASIVSIKKSNALVSCQGGFDWFNKNAANPNVIEGAIVGGPDASDTYTDTRSDYQKAEPSTSVIAPVVGVLARIA